MSMLINPYSVAPGAPPPGTYTASGTNEFPGFSASYTVFTDGNDNTGYGSNTGGGGVVTLTFASSVLVSGMQMRRANMSGWGDNGAYAQTVSVDYWDGSAWASFSSYAQGSLSTGWNALTVSTPRITTQLRLTGTSNWFGIPGIVLS